MFWRFGVDREVKVWYNQNILLINIKLEKLMSRRLSSKKGI